jgi:hypothetical protein
MQIEYLSDQANLVWGTVFEYDTRDWLVSNSNIDNWIQYPSALQMTAEGDPPWKGATALILDIDVADESPYTASNVRVKLRKQATGGGISIPGGGTVMNEEQEALNLRGFETAPSHKQIQAIVPLSDLGTFEWAYEVSGELPLIRHIKVVGQISEFDLNALNTGTKISQLQYVEGRDDDLFIISRCSDTEGERLFITDPNSGARIPDFTTDSRKWVSSHAVSMYHLRQGLGLGAYAVISNGGGAENVFVNCFMEQSGGADTYVIKTLNGLFTNKQCVVLASSTGSQKSGEPSRSIMDGGYISVGKVQFPSAAGAQATIPGQKLDQSYDAQVNITQYKPAFKVVTVSTGGDDRKDYGKADVYAPAGDQPETYTPGFLYVAFIGR